MSGKGPAFPARVVLATSNSGKLREMRAILAPWQVEVLPLAGFTSAVAQETGLSFVENAILKARFAAQVSGLAAIADDSGLEVDALHGAPGIRSARYAGDAADDAANNARLLRDLAEVPDDRITLIPEKRLATVIPPPKSVKIELVGRCNYRCAFCALAVRQKQPIKDMDLDFFKRITREMRDAAVEEIGVFFIGESFLNPDLLISAVQYLKRELEMPYVFLTSNASAASTKVVAELMRSGLDSLKWSVNAADPEQFGSIMKVSARLFDYASINIRKAFLIRGLTESKTRLYASSIQYDGEQQERMKAYLEAYVLPFVDEFYWLPLYSMGSFATAREAELGYRPTAGNQGRMGALRDPLPCWSAFTEGHVTVKGHLSACCFDATDTWTMADLHSVSFMEGWNSLDFLKLRAAHLRRDVTGTACEKCIAYQGG